MATNLLNKVCLIVIDGWGISDETNGNAITNADTPIMDQLCSQSPHYITLNASGLAVGLPKGLMGNSEVGHLNIGAGRPVYQDIVRINLACEDGSIDSLPNLIKTFDICKSGSGRLHLVGLISNGGVHSHMNHAFKLLEAAKKYQIPQSYLHFISDGRDTKPTSGAEFLTETNKFIDNLNYGHLATLMGRFYAMDRDKRYERIKIAYEAYTQGIGEKVATPDEALALVKSRYGADGDQKQTDEFMKPIIINPEGTFRENDCIIFFNYRSDRMRQISEAVGIKPQFDTQLVPKVHITCMTQYKAEFPYDLLFPPNSNTNVLAEWLSIKGVPQFHCAETEKYAHVTFFFNGGQEKQFSGEERKLIPSPQVETYDLKPEMSVDAVAEEICSALSSQKYPFVMCNLAPPDMVGHTGRYEPTLIACQRTDAAIGKIKEACATSGYVLLVTSDHGNAEKMYSETGGPHTAHTTNRVPLCMSNSGERVFRGSEHDPALCDVAPTVLDLMGYEIPKEMSGKSLLKK